MKTAPSLIIRLNQSLLESEAIVSAEKTKVSSKIRNLDINLREDGLHVSGGWKALFFTLPFDTIVAFVTTGVDVFEIRVREIKVAGLDLEFLTKFIFDSIQTRMDHALKGVCTFNYLGKKGNQVRALQVKVNPAALVPAFPQLHLVDVDVRDREFLMKIGNP